MTRSTLQTIKRKIAMGTAALCASAAALVAAPASAELVPNATDLDWYVYAGFNANDRPIVVFFQSEAGTKDFEPVGSVAIVRNADYSASGTFDPTQACLFTSLDFSQADAEALEPRLIYGPNSEKEPVSIVDLPSFMAQQASVALIQYGVIDNEDAAAPYFNCTGWVWSQLLSQSPETWEEIFKAGGVER